MTRRRHLLAPFAAWATTTATATTACAAEQPSPAAGPGPGSTTRAQGTRLLLLGTMAGPVLDASRAMCSQLVQVKGKSYLVDCGYAAIQRMTEMGVALRDLHQVLITHHHSDHTADYPALVNLSWIMGRPEPLRVFGPPPLLKMHAAALQVFEEDAAIRIRATGRQAMASAFDVQEIARTGVIHEDAGVRITAMKVAHPPFETALGYRFDTADRSIALSGDTAPCEQMVELARGCDVLVHEAMLVDRIDRMLARRPYVPPQLREFLLQGHSTAADAGRVAARAGVRTLVLSHLLPGNEGIPDAEWIGEARRHFKGRILVGRDRMVV
ncbi:MAG: MBL fold metallo-hydrolase [Curvibacter sp.]|nr:MBL fold metallo-hydrolase [Curvibacter sp.]